MKENKCPICSSQLEDFKIFDKIPSSSAQLYTNKDKVVNYNEQVVGVCANCNHITNYNLDTEVYEDSDYITKKSVSSTMSNNLKDIISFIDIKDSSVLEIGSGSGEVANHFANNGNKVTTIDPCIQSYDNLNINHHQGFLDDTFEGGPYDLIIARHVLEHVKDPVALLKLCASKLNDGYLYIEVPNMETTIHEHRLADFFNDHAQHFSPNSLATAGSLAGLEVVKTKSILNAAHHGVLFQKISNLDVVGHLAKSKEKINSIVSELTTGFTVYGAGAHAATFVGSLDDSTKNNLVTVIDKDTNKTGKYLPGTSVPISLPAPINTDILVNSSVLYKNEIEAYLRQELGDQGKIIHI